MSSLFAILKTTTAMVFGDGPLVRGEVLRKLRHGRCLSAALFHLQHGICARLWAGIGDSGLELGDFFLIFCVQVHEASTSVLITPTIDNNSE